MGEFQLNHLAAKPQAFPTSNGKAVSTFNTDDRLITASGSVSVLLSSEDLR